MSEKSSAAEADQWVGTYKLISATRTDLETGQVMVGEPYRLHHLRAGRSDDGPHRGQRQTKAGKYRSPTRIALSFSGQ